MSAVSNPLFSLDIVQNSEEIHHLDIRLENSHAPLRYADLGTSSKDQRHGDCPSRCRAGKKSVAFECADLISWRFSSPLEDKS